MITFVNMIPVFIVVGMIVSFCLNYNFIKNKYNESRKFVDFDSSDKILILYFGFGSWATLAFSIYIWRTLEKKWIWHYLIKNHKK